MGVPMTGESKSMCAKASRTNHSMANPESGESALGDGGMSLQMQAKQQGRRRIPKAAAGLYPPITSLMREEGQVLAFVIQIGSVYLPPAPGIKAHNRRR